MLSVHISIERKQNSLKQYLLGLVFSLFLKILLVKISESKVLSSLRLQAACQNVIGIFIEFVHELFVVNSLKLYETLSTTDFFLYNHNMTKN